MEEKGVKMPNFQHFGRKNSKIGQNCQNCSNLALKCRVLRIFSENSTMPEYKAYVGLKFKGVRKKSLEPILRKLRKTLKKG